MRIRTLPFMAKTVLLTASITLAPMMTSNVMSQDAAAKEKTAKSDAKPNPKSIGYFLGISMGQQMAQSGIALEDFDQKSMMRGFVDGMNKKDSVLTDDQLKSTQAALTELLQARREAMVEDMKAEGVAFLAANKDKDGVKTLESGLQYKVIEAGEGESPAATDTVKVHYTGKLINGKTFDSSIQRGQPATFRVGQVIPGWQEGIQKMKVGSKWMLYIPSDLAYGANGSPGAIGPHQVLVFEVELLEIM
ncbi:FKBP-type 22 kDa peptidyl-prolyl cis-trans isomerase [Rubripirellula obstinata]|uniref:Peptidyl-prolyl cis-trans isomerase n=1 Tax=Rubripirellula obstinata TaxID=406547 RepID=A0A5B1CQI7_9BACT|nr:FKBP-type peptidyl-prolyl cis-trans isomerase [Rubripirellula obstinata]KAA1262501.1 FKBP-type 22 kDa peptidyl-prolyl cis-trans isomerase [Rubripirellula obstinata]